jgi:hypothetical protein
VLAQILGEKRKKHDRRGDKGQEIGFEGDLARKYLFYTFLLGLVVFG